MGVLMNFNGMTLDDPLACKACNGFGSIYVPDTDELRQTCPSCQGSGYENQE
jgi:DnaJ-class molecular chaperone